jgi:2-iminobutanoate/2-iminopropanoate deaminase
MKRILLSAALLAASAVPVAAQSPFSPIVEANGVIYLAGQLGRDPETRRYPDDIQAQTGFALDRVKALLTDAGASLSDVVRCQVFMTQIEGFGAMNATYRTYFPVDPPARTTVGIEALAAPDALIEIECTAVRGHGQNMEARRGDQEDT